MLYPIKFETLNPEPQKPINPKTPNPKTLNLKEGPKTQNPIY